MWFNWVSDLPDLLSVLSCSHHSHNTRMLFGSSRITDTSRLNLTAANHVFLMEPQWNPMIEDQALDRVYRIGQQKEVTTTRYIVNKSLEEVC